MSKRVLIIGGAGFLGFNLAKKFLNNKYQVDIIDNFQRGRKDKDFIKFSKSNKLKILNINIFKFNKTKINKNYDYIFNLAAIVGVKNVLNNPYSVLINNLENKKKAIEIATYQKKLKKFIFTSTSEVYAGSLENKLLKFPTKESNIIALHNFKNPRATYMISKIYGEIMCHNSGLPFLILRPHNIYGPRMGTSHVIPELIIKFYKNAKNLIKINNPYHKRTFCYIDDAVSMIFKLTTNNKTKFKTFNIGNQSPEITMIDLSKKIYSIVSPRKKIKIIGNKRENDYSPKKRCPDTSSLKKIISLKKNSNLDQGIKKTFKWYKRNYNL